MDNSDVPPPWLLGAQLVAESNLNPNAVSPAGAIGPAQFMPETARQLGIDPRDPMQAMAGQSRYMSQLYRQTGSWPGALAAYNEGIGNYQKRGPGNMPPETQSYVNKIMNKIPMGSPSDLQKLFDNSATSQTNVPSRPPVNMGDASDLKELFSKSSPKTPAAKPESIGQRVSDLAHSFSNEVARGAATFPQEVRNFGRAATLPYLHAGELIPGPVGRAATAKAQQFQQQTTPMQRFVGGAAGMLPIYAVAPEMGLVGSTLANAGIGAATAPSGERLIGGLAGGVFGGAGPLATKVGRSLLKSGDISPDVLANMRNIASDKQSGYKLLPSQASGMGKARVDISNPGSSKVAAQNYRNYERTMASLSDIPSQRINAQTLAAANRSIPKVFMQRLSGKSVEIQPEVADAVRGFVVKQPALAEQLVTDGGKGLANSLDKVSAGGKISASDWFSVVRSIKSMRYKTSDPLVKSQLSSVIKELEQPVGGLPKDVQRAYRAFNAKYRANSIMLNASAGSPKFLSTGKLNPMAVWGEIVKDADTPAAKAAALSSKDTMTKTARLASQLHLIPQARELGDEQYLNIIQAAGHASHIPGMNLGMGSITALPRLALHSITSKALHPYYASPLGQRVLMGADPITPGLRRALALDTGGMIGGFNSLLPQSLPSPDNHP
jgi:hypothetical protein